MTLPAPHPVVSALLSALLSAGLIVSASSGCSPAAEEDTTPASAPITFSVTAPATGSFVRDLVTVSGVLKVSSKVPASSLRTVLRIKGKTLCQHWDANMRFQKWTQQAPTDPDDKALYKAMVSAHAACDQQDAVTGFRGVAVQKTFSFTFDSGALDLKNKALTKDGKLCVALSAVGLNASGEQTVCMTVDNTPPVVILSSPGPDSVQIGTVKITGTLKEKNLKQLALIVDNKVLIKQCVKDAPEGSEENCDLCRTKYRDCLKGSGSFSFVLDRSTKPSEDLEVRVVAVDRTDHILEIKVPFKKLKAPRFVTAREDFDGELNKAGDLVTSKIDFGKFNDFALVDVDHDGLLDAALAASKGLYIRHGLAHPDPKAAQKDGWGRFGETLLFATGDFSHLQAMDLDGDKHEDIVALGEPKDMGPRVMMFLTRENSMPIQAAALKLDVKGSALAHADLNNDGRQDLIIGSEVDAYALTLVYLLKTALCPIKTDPNRTCSKVPLAKNISQIKLVDKTVVRKLLSGVNSIATADFVQDSSEPPLLDIAVGRKTDAILSVCQNLGDDFGACVDMTEVDALANMSDTAFINPIQMNDDDEDGDVDEDDIPDLIITSKEGYRRWVSGDHEGGFEYLAKKSNGKYKAPYKSTAWVKSDDKSGNIEDVQIAPVGPNGEDYLLVSIGSRSITLMPADPTDSLASSRCYPTYVLGRGISRVRVADIDKDGELDLVGLISGLGLAIAEGAGEGRFRAARIRQICRSAVISNNWTVAPSPLTLGQYKIIDLTGDGRDDLLMVSTPSTAIEYCPPEPGGGGSPQTRPAFFFNLYLNSEHGLVEAPRAGEYAPHATMQLRQAAGVKDLLRAGCGEKFAPITGLEFGNFGGGAAPDMVTTYDLTYSSGGDALEGGDVILSCAGDEVLEVMNLFGEETSDDKDNLSVQCKLFHDKDKDKETPVKGFGGGAYLKRSSLNIWINGDVSAPFGMDAASTLMDSKRLKPTFAQSAGSAPIAVAVGKFDEDNIDDIATLMLPSGTLEDPHYMAERIRLFKGDGKGKVSPILYLDKTNSPRKVLVQKYCQLNQTNCSILPVNLTELSPQPTMVPPAAFVTFTYPSYRIVAPKPISLRAAPFCKEEIDSLFTLSNEAGNVTVLRQQGGMKFSIKKSYSVADSPMVFETSDVNKDKCTDLLVAGTKRLGFTPGNEESFGANQYFDVPSVERNGVATLDVNTDGFLDLLVVNGHLDAVETYLGDGEGHFVFYPKRLFVGPKAGRMSLGDLNSDGCPDLAVQGLMGVTVLTNLGCATP